MWRRPHNPSPAFRLPQPFDSVVGGDAPLSPLAPMCRFVLTEELTTSMDRASAEITNQYGAGPRHNYSDTVKVLNLERGQAAGSYAFSGSVGDAGLARWHTGQLWVIVAMDDVGGLVGACLDEDHPGRGVEFDVNLGVWDPDSHVWIYDMANPVKAIDWRFGVPYPSSGATGLFEARSSTTYGVIWEVVSLDCESPGECGS